MTNDPIPWGVEEKGFRPFVFDFDQFELMDAAGVFAGRDRPTELIEGRLIEMSPAGADHTKVTSRLVGYFFAALEALDTDLMALTQGTLKIENHSGPEPDVFIARSFPGRKYFEAKDAVLVVEVAVSTFEPDRSVKAPMYARAGIPELWIVEPAQGAVHVYRQPGPDGTWGEMFVVTDGDASPLFAPSIRISLPKVFAGL